MITLKNLTKKFGARTVFNSVSYTFPQNRLIALVGANGVGKTTLLNILSGLEDPDDGLVQVAKDLSIGYLPQDPNSNPKPDLIEECVTGAGEVYRIKQKLDEISLAMEQEYTAEIHEQYDFWESEFRRLNGYSLENRAEKILLGLGFKEEHFFSHPKDLSGGWKMRLELAKILLQDPDFLILDEPTNHLDLPSIVWLEDYLRRFKGTLLFVSHDEDLLNRLPNVILHLKSGNLKEYQGNFDDFLEQYEAIQAESAAQVRNLDAKAAQLNKFIDRFKAKSSKATQARSKMKMVARLHKQIEGIEVDKDDAEVSFKFIIRTKSGVDVALLENCSIGYDKPLVKEINLHVERGQKIAIIGANGLGKSTLLKSIMESTPFLSGDMKVGHNTKIACFSQDQYDFLDMEQTVLENISRQNIEMPESKIRALLGCFLFRKDDVHKKAKVLSGGEKSRLSMASLLMQDANFLLLDEPTNHLDMASTDVLADALADYEGTIMFVSHNRKFINLLATHIIVIDHNRKVHKYKGNLEENLDKPAIKKLFESQMM